MLSVLFHGTSNTHVESITRKGLLPRGRRKSNWEAPYQARTPGDLVYLTGNRFNASFYALRTAIANSCPQGLVVRVTNCHKLEDAFYPDENYFIGKNINEGVSREQMKAAQRKIKKNKEAWKACLEQKDIVAHKGEIGRNHLEVDVIPNEENPFSFLAGDTVRDFDRRFHALLAANRYFGLTGTFFSDRIREYKIIKDDTRYECHIPGHGVTDVSIHW